MFYTLDPSFLTPVARVIPSLCDEQMHLPLTDSVGIGGDTSNLVLSTSFASEGISYPPLSYLHSYHRSGSRRRHAHGGLAGESEHAKAGKGGWQRSATGALGRSMRSLRARRRSSINFDYRILDAPTTEGGDLVLSRIDGRYPRSVELSSETQSFGCLFPLRRCLVARHRGLLERAARGSVQ